MRLGDDKFVHGAGTSCNATVFAYAAAQIKKAMEITKELGGENYVFWVWPWKAMKPYLTQIQA